MNEKFMVFSGYNWYPSGGFEDYVGLYQSVEEVKKSFLNNKNGQWVHIVDLSSMKIVSRAIRQWSWDDEKEWEWEDEEIT